MAQITLVSISWLGSSTQLINGITDMILTSVLAEIDRTWVPLCYLLVDTNPSEQISSSADAGATISVLQQLYSRIRVTILHFSVATKKRLKSQQSVKSGLIL